MVLLVRNNIDWVSRGTTDCCSCLGGERAQQKL